MRANANGYGNKNAPEGVNAFTEERRTLQLLRIS